MKAALISLGSKSSQWTSTAMKNYFDSVDDIDLRKIEVNIESGKINVTYEGKPLGEYDCIYAKGSFRYSELLQTITLALSKRAYMPICSDAFNVGNDKLLTHLLLQEANVPMPTTYLANSAEATKNILKRIQYPIIMKLPKGTQGKGVMFADSFASASSMLDALTVLNQPFLIQEYIETGGTDLRIIVAGDKIIAAMRRCAVAGEKRANIHAGGQGEPCELNSITKKVAIRTANAVRADICAVDILDDGRGPKVIEVNLSPGLQGITAATKIDVADRIAKYLYEMTKQATEKAKITRTDEILHDIHIDRERESHELIMNLDFRGNRILLPEMVTDITKFNDQEEIIIQPSKGKLIIKKFE